MFYIDKNNYITYLKNLLILCSFSNDIIKKYSNIVEILWQEYLICKDGHKY